LKITNRWFEDQQHPVVVERDRQQTEDASAAVAAAEAAVALETSSSSFPAGRTPDWTH
jgi:hypothetical protein